MSSQESLLCCGHPTGKARLKEARAGDTELSDGTLRAEKKWGWGQRQVL